MEGCGSLAEDGRDIVLFRMLASSRADTSPATTIRAQPTVAVSMFLFTLGMRLRSPFGLLVSSYVHIHPHLKKPSQASSSNKRQNAGDTNNLE
mmetsp:Transcript_137911/g.257287  ORF Transcript_137911/g.257287 Transcript_137911/m.257287 type:complete len:93 (-) Transcript_137911:253-531(-)